MLRLIINWLSIPVLSVLLFAGICSASDIFSAAEQGNPEQVKALLEANPQLISATDAGGYTALHKAAYADKVEIARYLISKGANVDARSGGGSTPLHGAARGGFVETIRLLIDNHAKLEIANNAGYTPLLTACASGTTEAVRLLLSLGANAKATNGDGWTTLMFAVSSGNVECARLLLEKGGDVNIAAADGTTPLSQAVFQNNKDMVELLVNGGANVDAFGVDSTTPLFFAVSARDTSISNLLIDKGTVFNIKNRLHFTMLHYAAALGSLEQVHKIVGHGVDINAQCINGRTALDYARTWRRDSVAAYLIQAGAMENASPKSSLTGEYFGQKRPGKQPEVFAENLLLTPFGPHGSIAFSPDGHEVFWCHHAQPIQAMWHMKFENGVWSRPEIAPFTDPRTEYWDGGPSFSANGNRLYYYSHRPLVDGQTKREDADIWYVDHRGNGWGSPVSLGAPINTDKDERDPSVSGIGTLYFVGEDYEGGLGRSDIYVSEYVNGRYATPKNLGPAINGPEHEITPAIASNESYLIFASTRPHPDQGLNLYVSFRDYSGNWTEAVSFGQSVIAGNAMRPFITPDGTSVIFQPDQNYHWFSTRAVEDLRWATVAFDPPSGRRVSLKRSEQDFGPAETRRIVLADLDSDDDLDAVFSSGQVWLNDGKANFVRKYENMAFRGHGVDVGDIDGDGDVDIAFASQSIPLYVNDGKANFTRDEQTLGGSAGSVGDVLFCDVDSDGDLDLSSFQPGDLRVTDLNDGHGHFTASNINVPDKTGCDLDADGDIDFFVRKQKVGCSVMLNDGHGIFTEHWSLPDTTLDYGFVSLGDLDKDGDADAVVTNGGNDDIFPTMVMLNDGTGKFTVTQRDLPPTRWGNVAFGDLDDDGNLDALVTNFKLPNYVLLNDGHGRLVDAGLRLGGPAGNMISALGDLDGDGDLDAFISTFELGSSEVWLNQR